MPEAQKIKILLEDENIPCEVHSFENWGYNGVFRGQMGMGEIVVPDELTDRAKAIVDKFIKEERNAPGEMDPASAKTVSSRTIANLYGLILIVLMAFIAFGFFLLLGVRGNAGIALYFLLTGVVLAVLARIKKVLRKTKKELEETERPDSL